MTAALDAPVVVAHLVGEPAELAHRARRLFTGDELLLLSDVAVADVVRLLELGDVDRHIIATALRSLIAHPTVVCLDVPLLLRALDVYEVTRIAFPASYAASVAEQSGVGRVVSFDAQLDRVRSIQRLDATDGASP